jgi:D-glycero-D-manno-heptose 1,7-bisphosphate phosphatase
MGIEEIKNTVVNSNDDFNRIYSYFYRHYFQEKNIDLEKAKKSHDNIEICPYALGDYNIYFCPHHPDTGFEGEVPELKINCDCRKPNIGMFVAASKKYSIALDESIMVGDGDRDIEAGKKPAAKAYGLMIS